MPDGSGALMFCRNVLLSVVELSGFQPGAPLPGDSARGQALDLVLSVTVWLSRPVGQHSLPVGNQRTVILVHSAQ